ARRQGHHALRAVESSPPDRRDPCRRRRVRGERRELPAAARPGGEPGARQPAQRRLSRPAAGAGGAGGVARGGASTATAQASPAGVGAAALAVTSWGLGNVMARFIALTGPSLSFDRQWFGTAYTFALLGVFRRRLSWRALIASVPGGITFGANQLLFFTAVKYTAVTSATIIAALQPAILMFVVGRLFGERVRAVDVGATLTALCGTAVVVLGGHGAGGDHVSGDLLAGASVILWAAYFVASKRARRRLGTIEYQAAMTVVAAVVVTPVALLYGAPLWTGWGTAGWVVLLALGPGGGHYLMNWAHEHIPLTLASLLTLGLP